MSLQEKVYLGDGAYVAHSNGAFILTAENGIEVTDEVVLAPDMLLDLVRFAEQFYPNLTTHLHRQKVQP